ncbi:MAG: hypothetical protein Q9227_001016 [Pyrenula ochraceoflavens]
MEESDKKKEKEKAREQARQEKAAKFAAKQERLRQVNEKASSKPAKKSTVTSEVPEYVERTPPGSKKILGSLEDVHHKAYIPKVVESAWYPWWEKEGFFKPEYNMKAKKDKSPFVIVFPPPNITGRLHIGHALATALEDTLIRWSRMRGHATLFLPGCDHASIATQSIVEKTIWRRGKQTRHDLGREKFLQTVWQWKEEYHQNINRVVKRIGASFDWDREAFTMDANLSAAVTETFVQLHDKGLIYRSSRLVNWCGALQTALSNLEVDNKELEGRTMLSLPGYDRPVEFGVLVYFRYKLADSEEGVEVATTRLETMLGDVAVAVNPKDERYASLVGKKLQHPFIDRLLPIVADNHVDPSFGSGCVKITPAHDRNDMQIGERHNLEVINIFNDDGTINANGGPTFAGQKRFHARRNVEQELTKLGLFVKKDSHAMTVPICSRSGDAIEPRIKPQWWVKMDNMAAEAINAVKRGDIRIKPESAEKSYFRWLEEIQDWCISRQLWWGHRIPAYRVLLNNEGAGDATHDEEHWVSGRTLQEAQKKAEAKFPGKTFTLDQDPDVLDTWYVIVMISLSDQLTIFRFSSGLWPFSTLGWPRKTTDLDNFYPTSILETGYDILFFWVSRMIMLGLKLTGTVPFREVYCHSLVRDSEGRKMSKSLGNVIDPVDVIDGIALESLLDKLSQGNLDPKELTTATKYQKTSFPKGIPECGADALRMSLVRYTTSSGGDISFDVNVMHGYRRFCNKMYQATKYVLGKLGDSYTPPSDSGLSGSESLASRWILHRLSRAAKNVNESIQERAFSQAAFVAYSYFYDDLCDVFIENSKAIIAEGSDQERLSTFNALYTALDNGLRMLHPFMPFITEELWQRLPRRPGDNTPSITVASFPEFDEKYDNEPVEAVYTLLTNCAKGIRSLINDPSYRGKLGQAVTIKALSNQAYESATSHLQVIRSLTGKGVDSISIATPSSPVPHGCAASVVSSSAIIFVPLVGDIDVAKETTETETKMTATMKQVEVQKGVVANPDLEKATAAARETERNKLAELETEVESYRMSIESLKALKIE